MSTDTSERGYTEAEGYTASLRQQAKWVRECNLDGTIDADELDAAADYIQRSSERIAEANLEIDVQRECMSGLNKDWNAMYQRALAAEARLAELSERTTDAGWQPIETAPKNGTDLLFCYWERPQQTDLPVVSGYWSMLSDGWFSTLTGHSIKPTHWRQPLAPPIADGVSSRTVIVGKVTGTEYEGDQVPGMRGAICHACGLKDYPCVNPDCPNAHVSGSTEGGNAS